MRILLFITIIITCTMCQPPKDQNKQVPEQVKVFDIQGHRGCRGLMPENTLPAFQKALELGVNTLELDLAVTADSQLVVSHEPYFRAGLSKDPQGNAITKEDELKHNIYKMTYEQSKKYDVGSTPDPLHPDRENIRTFKPLLRDVVRKAQQYAYQFRERTKKFNIEIKRAPEYDGIFHPTAEAYVNLVLKEVQDLHIWDETIIQSFDPEVLRLVKAKRPGVPLALLIENDKSVKENINELGFTPDIYSCSYQLLTPEDVNDLHDRDIQVIPWTVNSNEDIQKMIDMGVDGIISDYPDRVIAMVRPAQK